jgi:hypothetical protein
VALLKRSQKLVEMPKNQPHRQESRTGEPKDLNSGKVAVLDVGGRSAERDYFHCCSAAVLAMRSQGVDAVTF